MKKNWRLPINLILVVGLFIVVATTVLLSSKGYGQSQATNLTKQAAIYGHGPFAGSAQLMVDNQFVPEGAPWNSLGCVTWHKKDVYFLIDLGRVIPINEITIQVDNNDTYFVDCSVDGRNFNLLLKVGRKIGHVEAGMDIMSTNSRNPRYAPGLIFNPAAARYLKVYGGSGDMSFAVAEVQVNMDETSMSGLMEKAVKQQ